MNIKLDQKITLAQAGKILSISDQWLRELGKRGFIPAPVNGMVSMDKAIQGYLKWLKASNSQAGKNDTASKLQHLRAQEIEIRISQRLSELISTEDFSKSVEIVYTILYSEIINLPSLATNDFGNKEIIKAELDEFLKERVNA
jgi:hypothetical protein